MYKDLAINTMEEVLDEANISERIVYPGLDGICKWLSGHYFVKDS